MGPCQPQEVWIWGTQLTAMGFVTQLPGTALPISSTEPCPRSLPGPSRINAAKLPIGQASRARHRQGEAVRLNKAQRRKSRAGKPGKKFAEVLVSGPSSPGGKVPPLQRVPQGCFGQD